MQDCHETDMAMVASRKTSLSGYITTLGNFTLEEHPIRLLYSSTICPYKCVSPSFPTGPHRFNIGHGNLDH